MLAEGKGLLLLHRSADALPLLQRAVALSSELYDRERSLALTDPQIALADCFIDLGERSDTRAACASQSHPPPPTRNSANTSGGRLATWSVASLRSVEPRRP